MDTATLKARLAADKPVFGTWSHLPDPTVVEIVGASGLDFIVFDLEHGPHSFHQLPGLYCAAEAHGMLPVTRVPSGGNSNILRVLDSGGKGVMVPHVEGAAAAEGYLTQMRYAARPGSRGVATLTRCSMFNTKAEATHVDRQNDHVLAILMIEDRQALDELDAICALPGLDVVFIGNYDLAQSLGMDRNAPEFLDLYHGMVKRIRGHGLAVGGFAGTAEATGSLLEMGLRFITLSVDGAVLRRAYEGMLAGLPARD